MMQRSLIIIKPDAVQRGLAGEIIKRFEDKGLKLSALKMAKISRQLAERHYQEHRGKDFYQALVDYITSGPVILMVVQGPSAVDVVRQMIGPTDGSSAPGGTIRGDFAISMRYNLVHGSDSVESADREISLFFNSDELTEYDRPILRWCWQH